MGVNTSAPGRAERIRRTGSARRQGEPDRTRTMRCECGDGSRSVAVGGDGLCGGIRENRARVHETDGTSRNTSACVRTAKRPFRPRSTCFRHFTRTTRVSAGSRSGIATTAIAVPGGRLCSRDPDPVRLTDAARYGGGRERGFRKFGRNRIDPTRFPVGRHQRSGRGPRVFDTMQRPSRSCVDPGVPRDAFVAPPWTAAAGLGFPRDRRPPHPGRFQRLWLIRFFHSDPPRGRAAIALLIFNGL